MVKEIVESFRETCEKDTDLTFVVDESDSSKEAYSTAVRESLYVGLVDDNGWRTWERLNSVRAGVLMTPAVNMVDAMNKAAGYFLEHFREAPKAVAFMGDDHRPRTPGWDTAYLNALQQQPGFVYGNDLLQGRDLPTQVAISASVVRALGHMAPDVLTHLYVDDYWRTLGQQAGCLTYLPDVVVEHLHPSDGKSAWDDGYRRVNSPEMYERDASAYARYWREHGSRDVARVKFAIEREREHGTQQV
jgi:hypothetical protein